MRSPNEYDHQRSRPNGEVERVLQALRELVRERDLQHADAQAELERLKSRLAGTVKCHMNQVLLLILPAIAVVAVAALAGALARSGPRARGAHLPGPYHQAWTVTPGEHLAGDHLPAGSFLLLSGGSARLLLGEVLVTVEEGGVLRLTGEQRAQIVGPAGHATIWLASETTAGERRLGRVLRRPLA